jgi:hypothetical protein
LICSGLDDLSPHLKLRIGFLFQAEPGNSLIIKQANQLPKFFSFNEILFRNYLIFIQFKRVQEGLSRGASGQAKIDNGMNAGGLVSRLDLA